MIVTDFTRRALAVRREIRDMRKAGWQSVPEPCWEIVRGGRTREVILDVRISADSKGLWIKVGRPS